MLLSPEHKLLKSEEDLPPLTRQRSNTLPKSFGSQLEKKPAQEKVPKPPVESTLEGVLKKLQEKRDEVNRPEDIKVGLWLEVILFESLVCPEVIPVEFFRNEPW